MQASTAIDTHIKHPVFRAVRVGAAHVEPGSIAHRLDHPDVVPTVEVLEQYILLI